MSDELLFAELKAAEHLPSPAGIAFKILELTAQQDAALEDLVRLIQADPALSARLIKFANSPLIAPRRPIVAVQDAAARIGMNGVRNLVLGVSLVGKYRTGPCLGFDYERYWAKSLGVAVALAQLATYKRILAPEEAFTLGLLADIGRLALATAWPEEYARCLTEAEGEDLIAMERKLFALDHVKLTQLLLSDWGLPEIFRDALAHLHDPASATDARTQELAHQIAFAQDCASWCLAKERKSWLAALERQAGEHGILDHLPEFLEKLETAWHSWGHLIDIRTDLPPPASKPVLQPETSLPGLDIVLVDDDPVQLTRLAKQLQAAGHQVRTCRSGEQALKTIFEAPPQLVLTDRYMQPLDGLTLGRTLRQSPIGRCLYLIMITASDSEDALLEAFEAGVDDYVVKPVNLKVLLARIRAGQRIVYLQQELAKERAELEHKAKQLSRLSRKLEQLANTDLLTALPNRRYAERRLQQELVIALRYGRPLSVMVLDLDHFKSINDRLGHAAGDQVLKHAAQVMQQTLRASDVLCRWGGEEFLAILPNADPAAVRRLAERLRLALCERQPAGLALERPVTVSIGVASCPPAQDANDLLHRADQALYRAKDQGRNRVETA